MRPSLSPLGIDYGALEVCSTGRVLHQARCSTVDRGHTFQQMIGVLHQVHMSLMAETKTQLCALLSHCEELCSGTKMKSSLKNTPSTVSGRPPRGRILICYV